MSHQKRKPERKGIPQAGLLFVGEVFPYPPCHVKARPVPLESFARFLVRWPFFRSGSDFCPPVTPA